MVEVELLDIKRELVKSWIHVRVNVWISSRTTILKAKIHTTENNASSERRKKKELVGK